MSSASIRDFWSWFQEKEEVLFYTDEHSDEVFDEVSEKLSLVHEDLGFEMTLAPDDDGRREFVVSAGGLLSAFDSVCQMVSLAPDLQRWRVVGFKPRKEVEGYLRMDGQQVALDNIYVGLRRFGAYVAVTVYFPDFTEESEQVFGEAAFILLDLVLGERDVLRSVGPVEVCSLDDVETENLVPLRKLSEEFDSLCIDLAKTLTEETPTRDERRRALLDLHESTVELLDESVGEQMESFALRVRFFSNTQFEAETLQESLESRIAEAQVTSMKAPSLRGDGWTTTLDFNYSSDQYGSGVRLLEMLIDLGLDCHSELDLIQYTDVQLSSLVRSLPKINACLHYHHGDVHKAWEILDRAETDHMEDLDYWSLLAYLSARTGRIERFSEAFQRMEVLLDDEDALGEEMVGPLWQLACACALVGESKQACDLVEQILSLADEETAQEIRQELNESEDLSLIRGSVVFRDLQARIGGLH
jgi:hypothetical protein